MEKFEYITKFESWDQQLSEKALNKLGAEGWQLVSIVTLVFGCDISLKYYFMRKCE